MRVTQIVEVDKKRIQVKTEEGISFVLYKGEARSLQLKEDAELSREQYEEIRSEILVKRVRKRALFLLEKMDRTEYQLREKLRQGLYDEALIEEGIAYVKGFHYLDDDRYARNYVRFQKEKRSRRQIQMDLQKKGIAREKSDEILEAEYEAENEQDLILKWAKKKHYSAKEADIKEKQKMYQFLMRKGFRSDDILHVLDYLT